MEKIIKVETEFDVMEFKGIPVGDDFNYRKFALDNGFFNTTLDSIDNTEKFGGIGLFAAQNHPKDSDISYHLKKRLEIVFVNSLPIGYKVI